VGPDVRAPGTGVGSDAEDGSDLMILKTGGKDVGRAIAEWVGDQQDRSMILLPDIVTVLDRSDGKSQGKTGSGHDGLFDRGDPLLQAEPLKERGGACLRQSQVQRGVRNCPLGLDGPRREGRKPFRRVDKTPPFPRTSRMRPSCGSSETGDDSSTKAGVSDVEAEDADYAKTPLKSRSARRGVSWAQRGDARGIPNPLLGSALEHRARDERFSRTARFALDRPFERRPDSQRLAPR
jgi:hypothetical protein